MADMLEIPMNETESVNYDFAPMLDLSLNICLCDDLQSDDYPLWYKMYNAIVILILFPTIALGGIIGNLITFFVYTRKRMRYQSSSVYLAGLAFSDVFLSINGLVLIWCDSLRSYFPSLLVRSPYLTVSVLPFAHFVQTFSVYCIVVAAIDCFVQTCLKSYLAPHYCRPSTATGVLLIVFCSSLTYNLPRINQFVVHQCWTPNNSILYEICPTQKWFKLNLNYNLYLNTVVMTILPFVILVALTAFIMCAVRNRPIPLPQDLDRMREHSATTMVMVIVLFLLCSALALGVSLVETFSDAPALLVHCLVDVSNLMMIVNASVNVCIYYRYSIDFRQLFRSMLRIPDTDGSKPVAHITNGHCSKRSLLNYTSNNNNNHENANGNNKPNIPQLILIKRPSKAEDANNESRQPFLQMYKNGQVAFSPNTDDWNHIDHDDSDSVVYV